MKATPEQEAWVRGYQVAQGDSFRRGIVERINSFPVLACFQVTNASTGDFGAAVVVCDRAPEYEHDRYAVWTVDLEGKGDAYWGFYTDDLQVALVNALGRAGWNGIVRPSLTR